VLFGRLVSQAKHRKRFSIDGIMMMDGSDSIGWLVAFTTWSLVCSWSISGTCGRTVNKSRLVHGWKMLFDSCI